MYIEDDRYINIYNVAIGRGCTLFKFQSLHRHIPGRPVNFYPTQVNPGRSVL